MKFSDTLVGLDVLISEDKSKAYRKEESDLINSKTVVFQSQPITIRYQQSYILDLDMKSMGFGKIGVTTQNPLNIDVPNGTGLKIIKDLQSQNNKIMITEFPLYDTETKRFTDADFLSENKEKYQVHLLLLLDGNGDLHHFINFEHRGILFMGLELKYSWWLLFDLNGCLNKVSSTAFNGAPDEDMFVDEDGFKAYYNECTRSSRLHYQATLVVLQLTESEDALNEILDRSVSPEKSPIDSTKVRLKATCDYRSGEIIPEDWGSSSLVEESSVKDMEQGFIGRSETILTKECPETIVRRNQNASLNEKIELFEAEKFADMVVKRMKNKNEEKKTIHTNDIPFTDLSFQLPNVNEASGLPMTPDPEVMILAEGIISLFLESSCKEEISNGCDKCKDLQKGHSMVKKTYSSELPDRFSMTPNIEIEIELIKYQTMVQLQIMQCIGIRDPGVYMVILDIDAYLMCVGTNEDLIHLVEECLWLLYQRGPGQVSPQSVIIVLCYTKATLDYITSEKMVHNIQILKKLVAETCSRHEYRSIVQGEPTILGPSSTNRAEKIYDIKKKVLNLIAHSPNVARLVPEKWSLSGSILRQLSLRETKIMSFGQVYQILEDHCNTGVENVIRTLEYLSNVGVIPWIGDKNNHLNKRPDLPTVSRIMEAQASVIITDKEWLKDTVLQLENDRRKDSTSSEKIDDALKQFSYHKLLFILLLKFPSLAVENLSQKCLITIFDYPLHSLTSSFPLLSEHFTDNELTIYFILNQPFPWIYYLSLLLASIKMSSNYQVQPLNTSSAIQHFHLEDKHELDIFRISEKVIAASISCEISRKTNSNIISRVRQFVEQHMYQLSSTSSHRLSVRAAVRCVCNAVCPNHKKPKCTEEYSCLHFLHLDEILCNHVVFCGPRRISTAPWRELFPPIIPNWPLYHTKNGLTQSSIIHSPDYMVETNLPSWIPKVSKVLNMDDSSFNWKKLATKLGYKNENMKCFESEYNPAMSLLIDWMTTSGNDQLSMDFLILTLQESGQYHISDIIEADPECHNSQPQVFISYQWHCQTDAKNISEYLNKVGFPTWMDVGQMGGGDLLMQRIERAIRHCKVLIACVTPRYVVSTFCHRELVLGDLLKKPIIPVMITSVPWPPPGGTGLLLAPYVYIDMFGIGGHGGSGLNSDLASRYVEIETQVSKYCIRSKPIADLQRHSLIKIVPIQPLPSQPITTFHSEPHNVQAETSNHHQQSAFSTQILPVPSQTSVRECSSICTII